MSIRLIALSIALAAPSDAAEPKKPDGMVAETRVAKLIAQLDADDFRTREAATSELIRLGTPVIAALRQTLKNRPGKEVEERARHILDEIDWPTGGPAKNGLQLTIKVEKTAYRVGESAMFRVLVANGGKEDKDLELRADIGNFANFHAVAVVGQDTTRLGTFGNLNRGPTQVGSIAVPAQGAKSMTVPSLLGEVLLKGHSTELLKPGSYRVRVEYRGKDMHLQSNLVEISVKEND